jgi:jumonji domain-containing protein 2
MSAAGDFKAAALAEEAALPAAEQLPTPAEEAAEPGRLATALAGRERRYWRSVTMTPPIYGADVPGSLFDPALKEWNVAHLQSLLSRTLAAAGAAIPGVSTPYLYFGMFRSTFAWHTEDCDLASVNYLHFGAPKRWYAIPPAARARFETVVRGLLPDLFRTCPEFLRHKELLISPQLLEAHAIPVVRTTQYAGEFMLNFPGAYHAGFNFGYNAAESTNFATRAWIGVGAHARACACSPDSVTIQMSLFLRHAGPKARQAILEGLPSDSESDSESEADESSDEEEVVVRRKGGGGRRAATPESTTTSSGPAASDGDSAGSTAIRRPRKKHAGTAAAAKKAKKAAATAAAKKKKAVAAAKAKAKAAKARAKAAAKAAKAKAAKAAKAATLAGAAIKRAASAAGGGKSAAPLPKAKAPPAKRGSKTATRYTPVVAAPPPGAGRRGRVTSRTGRRVSAPGRLSL